MENRMIEYLMDFGLTRQEGVIYLVLLSNGEMTGYEVAKISGISRSNTYNALVQLVEKGAAYIDEGESKRYSPVSIREFTKNIIDHLNVKKKYLIDNEPVIRQKNEGYLTISGYVHVLDKIRNMIDYAANRIYFSAPISIIKKFEENLIERAKNDVKIVILTNEEYEIKNGIVYVMKGMEQIRLIVDTKEVLTGYALKKKDNVCLYSKNQNLVDLFKEMLRGEIILLEQKYNVEDTVLVTMNKEI